MEIWIARDRDGELQMFEEKPVLIKNTYFIAQVGTSSMSLDNGMFPEVTFENSPQEVELKLVNEL